MSGKRIGRAAMRVGGQQSAGQSKPFAAGTQVCGCALAHGDERSSLALQPLPAWRRALPTRLELSSVREMLGARFPDLQCAHGPAGRVPVRPGGPGSSRPWPRPAAAVPEGAGSMVWKAACQPLSRSSTRARYGLLAGIVAASLNSGRYPRRRLPRTRRASCHRPFR